MDAPEHYFVEIRTQHAFEVKPEPYVETVHYVRQDIADERVRVARREVWNKVWLMIHEVRIYAEATGRERNVISGDRRELLKAIEAARAAEGEG